MREPPDLLPSVRASTADLLVGLDAERWTDDAVAAPSLCAGWTRGHVLTHLARNADGIAATLAGALRGETVPRYPDGWDARNAAIDAGATRPMAALLGDVRESAERLDRVFADVAEAGAWDRPTEQGHVAAHWLPARWREVEIHRVDLAGDYSPDRWPPQLITTLLPEVARTLGERTHRPLRVTVTADGSRGPEHVGARWSAGDDGGEAVEVTGPDWAVLAWLIGRGTAAAHALSATIPLADWR